VQVEASDILKKFNRRPVFAPVSFDLAPGEVFGITGRNGSGKSTLLRIVGGLLAPSNGNITYRIDGRELDREKLHHVIGYAAPYLTLFEEFSAAENIELFASIRGLPLARGEARDLLTRVGLPTDRRDPIRAFSSGMKQRLKLIFAVMHRPPLLLLDEPISNLDSDGVAAVYELVRAHRALGSVIIATNDASDIAQCDRTLALGSGA
jgi:heme exporter protein A